MEARFIKSGNKVSDKVAELFVKIGIAKYVEEVTVEEIEDEVKVTEKPVLLNPAIPKDKPKAKPKCMTWCTPKILFSWTKKDASEDFMTAQKPKTSND
jgi:hypothetical protein